MIIVIAVISYVIGGAAFISRAMLAIAICRLVIIVGWISIDPIMKSV